MSLQATTLRQQAANDFEAAFRVPDAAGGRAGFLFLAKSRIMDGSYFALEKSHLGEKLLTAEEQARLFAQYIRAIRIVKKAKADLESSTDEYVAALHQAKLEEVKSALGSVGAMLGQAKTFGACDIVELCALCGVSFEEVENLDAFLQELLGAHALRLYPFHNGEAQVMLNSLAETNVGGGIGIRNKGEVGVFSVRRGQGAIVTSTDSATQFTFNLTIPMKFSRSYDRCEELVKAMLSQAGVDPYRLNTFLAKFGYVFSDDELMPPSNYTFHLSLSELGAPITYRAEVAYYHQEKQMPSVFVSLPGGEIELYDEKGNTVINEML